uniref:Uncharacterized protein n=1 Tax=Tanacetum cinerariifolium TaxID=118510 RepID=A0A699IRT4_TANCI|nr:hypothetical protein [Tanacetum cinerariifolium]
MLKHMLRGRLLASFQDREHEGGDTRSQGCIKDNDIKIKIQDHSMQMISQRNSQEQGSKIQESTNGAVNTAQAINTANGVSTASTQVNAAFFTNIDNLSDGDICALLASQPNSPQLAHEDLKQIHPDDMEEMDLR